MLVRFIHTFYWYSGSVLDRSLYINIYIYIYIPRWPPAHSAIVQKAQCVQLNPMRIDTFVICAAMMSRWFESTIYVRRPRARAIFFSRIRFAHKGDYDFAPQNNKLKPIRRAPDSRINKCNHTHSCTKRRILHTYLCNYASHKPTLRAWCTNI